MAAAGSPSPSSSSDRNAPYRWRGRNLLKLLIEKKIVHPLEPVVYRSKTKGRKAGKITNKGIICNCCCQIFSLTGFESHAGCHKHRPSSNIFLKDGRSIADCVLELKPNCASFTELGVAEVNGDHSLLKLGAINACYVMWENQDPNVARFLAIFIKQGVFAATFYLVLQLLNL